MTTTGSTSAPVRWGSAQARGVLAATVVGSGMAMLDGTIVNVALPKIGAEFGASVTGLQWVLDGYLLSLASLILVAGSLGDRYGRRRVFELGVVWFGLASVLCGVAPSTGVLVAARVLQGVGGALLAPGSLALLQATFAHGDRARAIGAWSGLGGVAAAVGPLVGGLLVQAWSWRLAFLVNVPVAVLCVYLCRKYVPESRDASMTGQPEVVGTVLCALGLAGVTGALVEGPARGMGDPFVLVALVVGVLSLIGFCVLQVRERDPLVPPDLFANRTFAVSNLLTFLLYAALGGVMMLMVMQLQVSLHYPPVLAGLAGLPITVIMLVGSARSGKLAQRIGPRLQLIVGPILVGGGMLMLRWAAPGASYLGGVLPGVVVFGLGLVIAVAPVTATVLAAAPDRHAGVASGVNNAVARTGSLLAVAVLPAAAGITGERYTDPTALTAGWQLALTICAIAAVAGGLIAFWVDNRVLGDVPATAEDSPHPGDCLHCGVEGPPTHVSPHQRSTVD